MSEYKKQNRKKQPSLPNEHSTICYLTSEAVIGTTAMAIWSGVAAGAQEHDFNLIGIAGGKFTEGQANIVYDLVSPEICAGIVTWAIANRRDDQEPKAIQARYQPLPIVSVIRLNPGQTVVKADDYQGMCELMAHLIEVHGCRRLAFVRAPEDHRLAEERFCAYRETLTRYEIPFDPALVTPAWSWSPESGKRAVTLFLDERGMRPGQDLDAIIAASDLIALGVLEALQNRSIQVPEDLALVGFNNSIEAQCAIPSITSVATNLPDQGREAVSVLKDLLDQSPVPELVVTPAHLAVHQSCGCLDETVVQAAAYSPPTVQKTDSQATLEARRKDIRKAMLQATGILDKSEDAAWVDKLLQAFIANLNAPDSSEFLSVLRQTLQHVVSTRRDVLAWQNVLSAIQAHIGLCQDPHQALLLLGQARTMVGQIAISCMAQQQLQADHYAEQLRLLNRKLLTSLDITKLANVLADGMPLLDIPSCYLALYEDPQPYQYPLPAPAWSRLIVAYDEGRSNPLNAGGTRFPTHQILPSGMWPTGRRYTMILQALYFQDLQIGFVLFEVGPQDWSIYNILRTQISSALYGALLMQQVQEHAKQLDMAVTETRATVQELEAFAYSVSHDLRAPLRSIDGFSQVLLEDYANELDTEGQDYLQRVRKASQRMGQLIDDLLSLSRITRQEMRREVVDLSALAREIVAELRQAEPARAIECSITDEIIVTGDPDLLRIVLNNLISNAWKFTSNRSPAKVRFYAIVQDHERQYIIQDNGDGFDMQYADKLFAPFQRLHQQTEFEGTGIGLAIVQRIIQRHGGRIWAEAAPDQGASLYFTLS